MFGQLGLLGITALCTTGDDGVGKDCTLNVRFKPKFPTSCPYHVTAVGGTMDYDPELGATFLAADISAQAFGSQIFVGGKEKEVYDTSGLTHLCVSWVVRPRAPDVLQAVAGIIFNDFQISDNRFTFCFLNPWLYGPAAQLLDDIQNRTNPGCNIDGFCRWILSPDGIL
ncbi:hypothetical protein EDB86DRAFT_3102108 [Lactarius hatsudake]|nr:hypothetical protein EDB86DRAFT_3102108 [Lactarius hatsudake]